MTETGCPVHPGVGGVGFVVGGNAVGVVVDDVGLHVNVGHGIGFVLILALVFCIGDGGSIGVDVADFPAVFF